MQIAVTSESAKLQDPDLAFLVAACNAQAAEYCAANGIPDVPVAFYSRGTVLPPGTTHAMVLVDDLDVAGALGYHDDAAGVIYGRVLVQDLDATGITLSHECLELIGDPTCDKWEPWSNGRQQAREACDRVEGDSYIETVTLLGETRGVSVSNYLLPAAFAPDSAGPWDRMGRLTSWDGQTPGGYCIAMDAGGNVSNVFASRGAVPFSFARKLTNAQSRTLRRLRNPPRPSVVSPEGAAA